MMDYIRDTGVFAKLKGRISETLLLSPSCSSSSSSSIIVRPLSRITTMGGAHRSGLLMELRLKCGDGIRVDAGFR